MIYLLYGTDTQTSRAKLHKLLAALSTKRPDAEIFQVTPENREEYPIESLVGSQGLFEQKYIVVFDQLFGDRDTKEELLAALKDMQSAEHVFVFLEGKLDKKTLTKFEKYAEKVEEHTALEEKKERFNTFALADALGKRDRKELWMLYQRAKGENIADEELHGLLFWQVKSMLLASKSASAKEAGLNPFVFQKATRFLKNYTEAELRALSTKLVSLSHDARRGIHDLDVALERFILSV